MQCIDDRNSNGKRKFIRLRVASYLALSPFKKRGARRSHRQRRRRDDTYIGFVKRVEKFQIRVGHGFARDRSNSMTLGTAMCTIPNAAPRSSRV